MKHPDNITRKDWILLRLEREARLRLFASLHQLPPEDLCAEQGSWRRASGGVRCTYCGLLYREHPQIEEWGTGSETDHLLCGGHVVHL